MRVPLVWTGSVETTDEMLFVRVDPDVIRQVEIPAGVYLRELADLDLDSPPAIGSFVEAHGNPGSNLWRTGPTWRELQQSWSRLLGPEEASVPTDLLSPPDEEVLRQMKAHEGTVAYSVAEFAERARLLRDLTRIHRYRVGDLTLDDVREGWESLCTPPPENDAWALAVLVVTMNWSLSGFQPLLEIELPAAYGVTAAPRFEDALSGYQPRLFEALSLQLFNDMAAKAKYRRCKNETCRRPFPIVPKGQDAPSDWHGAMRSSPDALFCTPRCARAQAQREYRRRESERKAAKRPPDDKEVGTPR